MFIFANLIQSLAHLLHLALELLKWMIIIRAILSWVNPDPFNPIVQFLHRVTEPVLNPIRRLLPFTYTGGFDFSPIVAFFLIGFLDSFVVKTLFDLSLRL